MLSLETITHNVILMYSAEIVKASKMLLRSIKNRLDTLFEKKLVRLISTILIFSVFLQQLHVFLNFQKPVGQVVVQSVTEKTKSSLELELMHKDPSLDFQCQCKELFISPNTSLCSDYSIGRGENQKVISVAYYPTSNVNVSHFPRLYEQVLKFYPNYILRVYHNVTESDTKEHKALCELFCLNDYVDLCDARRLGNYGDSSKFFAPLWKYATLADPMTEEVHFREPDQLISEREVTAIQDWKDKSDSSFVIMRDHPKHRFVIPKGMFGLRKTEKLIKPLKDTYEKMMLFSKSMKKVQDLESVLLEALIWPMATEDNISYDSFFCQEIKSYDTRAWLRRRETKDAPNFVGAKVGDAPLTEECPEKCRPPTNPDWTQC